VLNIIKKELDKVFKNPRLFITTFIMPGILIFAIYGTMGNLANSGLEKAVSNTSNIYVVDVSASFKETIDMYNATYPEDSENALNANFTYYESTNITKEELDNALNEGNCNAYIIFEKDFDEILNNRLKDQNAPLPRVQIYMLSTSTMSTVASQKVNSLLNILRDVKIAEVYGDVTILNNMTFDIADEATQSNHTLAMLLPMLLITFIFAGGLSIGTDAIAGEKERGTIATLLMAPINKNEIVLGKLIAAIIMTILSALSSFIGVACSLPMSQEIFGSANLTLLSFSTMISLFGLILSTALIAITIFMIASTIAKNIKEATTFAMPFYMIGIILSLSTMFMEKFPTDIGTYLIPIYNLSLGIKGTLIGEISTINLLIVIGSNLVYFVLGIVLMTKLFKNEKIMFSK
jgi:sodium transport system permease protein